MTHRWGLPTIALASFIGLAGCGNAVHSGAPAAGRGNAGQGGDAGDVGIDAAGGGGRASSLGGAAGGAGRGGAIGAGGSSDGGASLGGSTASNTGGNGGSNCLAGVPCSCPGPGVTTCENGQSSCSCPPPEQCQGAIHETPCFSPCGGDPVGAWVLDNTCLPGSSADGDCQRTFAGSGASQVRLQLLDDGFGKVYGVEDLDISAELTLACFGLKTVNDCSQKQFLSEALLFSYSPPLACTSNACGTCDCAAHLNQKITPLQVQWKSNGNLLAFGSSMATADYCVQGDELWFGGKSGSGNLKVAYKFKKMSCSGVPVACAARTPAQCAMGTHCVVGSCKSGSGGSNCAQATNQSSCTALTGCSWDPNGCSARANPQSVLACDFASCDSEPGCSWGPPTPKCGGTAFGCYDVPKEQCNGHGCAIVSCQPNGDTPPDCSKLTSTTDCAKAPGCVVNSGAGAPCSGQTTCIAQTDTNICRKLKCYQDTACYGEPSACSTLSTTECTSVLGCRIEW